MTARTRSLTLMAVQLLIVMLLWGKLHYDRMKLPRFWVQAAPVDPELPIRGRYLALAAVLPVQGFVFPGIPPRPKGWRATDPWPDPTDAHPVKVRLEASPSGLIAQAVQQPQSAEADSSGFGPEPGIQWGRVREDERSFQPDRLTVTLNEGIPCFIPERAKSPAQLADGETLWMEVTLPAKGPLRVIRLAVKDARGTMRVLNF
ncbi:MAG TPA: hypothetical protein VFF76_10005 [Holophagaceae bacterium]|jgi:hypothetical protein|nr:hypothetical protein [Holophagaceae bacterium]